MKSLPSVIERSITSLLIYFLTALISFATTLIATRKLVPVDFGLYQFLLVMSSLFLILVNSLSWFIVRFTARGYSVFKEALIYGVRFTFISDLLLIASLLAVDLYFFKIGYPLLLLVFFLFFSQSLFFIFSSFLLGNNPVLSYVANLIQAAIKLALLAIFIFIFLFRVSVELLLSAFIISNLIASIYPLFITQESQKNLLKKDLRFSLHRNLWFPFIWILIASFSYYDASLMAILLSSTLPIAYFRSAFIVSFPITYLQTFVINYYKEFLEKGKLVYLQQAIKTIFLFGSMLLFLIISLGNLLLSILRPEYNLSYLSSIFLAISFMLGNIISLFEYSIQSIEKRDLEEMVGSLKKSMLFKIIKIKLIQLVFQFSTLAFLAYLSKIYNFSAFMIATYWSLVWVFFSLIGVFLYSLELRKLNMFQFPFISVLKYLMSGLISCLAILFIKPAEFPNQLIAQLLVISPLIALYMAVFFLILLAVDKSVRIATKSLLNGVFSMISFKS